MRKRTRDLLLDVHDLQELERFCQYLSDMQTMGKAEFYRKYQEYLGLTNAELAAILSERVREQKEGS